MRDKRHIVSWILLYMLICIQNLPMQAQDSKLIIQMKDGGIESFLLADKPTITFSDTQLNITSLSLATSYDRSTIKKFHFEKLTSDGLDNVSPRELRVIFLDNNLIQLIGLSKSDQPIHVYDITGCMYPSTIVDSTEKTVTISLENITKGTYIIKTNRNKSIKIKN